MDQKAFNDIPTSAISVVETEHGRMRRSQRGIHKKDLQSARKYGDRKPCHRQANGDPAAKYTWKNIVYVTNEKTNEEITSYAVPIKLDPVPITSEMRHRHDKAKSTLHKDKTKWQSNTVIVIDTSGSMRESDVWGARNRLDTVWISVALDFLATRIENGCGIFDVVSIVSMGDTGKILVLEQPTTYVLYNQIVDFYTRNVVLPQSHGNYIPALDVAESLISANTNESCAIGLLFISDGRPSDRVHLKCSLKDSVDLITKRIASLAKKFGRTLSFDAVGIGDEDNFDTLQKMVDEAKDYGANASLKLPSKTSSALGDVLHSFASSVTSTQTEMTDLFTSTQQQVRRVERESKLKAKAPISQVSEDEFFIYEKAYAKRFVWKENYIDDRWVGKFEEKPLYSEYAEYVALNQRPFGEGKERFAFRFYELYKNRKTIAGKPLVAKESRFICEKEIDNEAKRKTYVETFCKTQQLAGRIAKEFNEKLDWLNRVDNKTPRVEMLDCCIYEIDDIALGNLSVLVEERLDEAKWQKWNSNNGYVQGMTNKPNSNLRDDEKDIEKLESSLQNFQLGGPLGFDLGILEECEEDEDSTSGEGDDDLTNVERSRPILFSPFEVAQAFSHFSYWATGKKRLICDIQGVYDEEKNMLRLSDPVIHYQNHRKQHRRMVHGKTDRGMKGVAMFFETHTCSKLCGLVTKGFKVPERRRRENYLMH